VLYVASVFVGIVGVSLGTRWLRRSLAARALDRLPGPTENASIEPASDGVTSRYRDPLVYGGAVLLLAALLVWPLAVSHPEKAAYTDGLSPAEKNAFAVLGIALVGIAVALFARPRLLAAVTPALAGAAALMSMHLFGTCFAWFDASYQYGTDHWERMVMGMTSNLPGLLHLRFGWRDPLEVLFTVGSTEVTVKTALFSLYAVLLVFASAGVALHDKWRSTGFLTAIVTPWLLFFTIPCQIHERYLLFAACAAAVCVGHRIGLTLLGLFLTFVTAIMTLHVMFIGNGMRGRMHMSEMLRTWYPDLFDTKSLFVQKLYAFIVNTHPDIGWAIILVTGVFFYLTVRPPTRLRRVNIALAEATDPEPETITAAGELPQSLPTPPAAPATA
jgi:hypothetical protein